MLPHFVRLDALFRPISDDSPTNGLMIRTLSGLVVRVFLFFVFF